jgi:hypothetical protein
MIPSGEDLIVHEVVCRLLGWIQFLLSRTLGSLRNSLCILQEFLILFLESYPVCENIYCLLAFVVYFEIFLLCFNL